MKLKLNEQGFAAVVDGKPIVVHDDGKELPFDIAGTVARISALNAEAKSHREAKETFEAKLKAFGDLDPEAARTAVLKLKDVDDKKLIDAGKAEEVRAAAVKAYEDRIKAMEAAHTSALKEQQDRAGKLESQLHSELIGGNFARSKFLNEKVAIPVDFVQATFGRNFRVEDGKIAAYDNAGNRMYSRARPGDPNVDFDEAIEMLVDSHPLKASILKGSGASGGGASASVGAGGKKSMTRAAFDALDPAAKAQAAREATITDA